MQTFAVKMQPVSAIFQDHGMRLHTQIEEHQEPAYNILINPVKGILWKMPIPHNISITCLHRYKKIKVTFHRINKGNN